MLDRRPKAKSSTFLPMSPKRVTQACFRCKIKKIKCCGSNPCTKCKASDGVCCYGVRFKSETKMVSKIHVDRLVWQQNLLIKALKVLWYSSSESNSSEEYSVHTIIAHTGVLEGAVESISTFETWNLDIETTAFPNLLIPSGTGKESSSSESDQRGFINEHWFPAPPIYIDQVGADTETHHNAALSEFVDIIPIDTSSDLPELALPEFAYDTDFAGPLSESSKL